jgi:hypothetical protein
MKKENDNKSEKELKDMDVQPPKGSHSTKTMDQRQRKKNTDDISMNNELGTDHNSDPILAKKQ